MIVNPIKVKSMEFGSNELINLIFNGQNREQSHTDILETCLAQQQDPIVIHFLFYFFFFFFYSWKKVTLYRL
jgi:hypothetical protein